MGAIFTKERGDSAEPLNDRASLAPSNSKQQLTDEERYRIVINKYKALFDSPRDEDGKLLREPLIQRVEDLVDKSLERVTGDDEPVQNYDTFLDEQLSYCKFVNLGFKVFRYKHVGPGSLETYVRFSYNQDEDFELAGTHYYNTDCKIYKAIVMQSLSRRVPGQVTADKRASITSSQTERQFCKKVHELPSLVRGQYLAAGDTGMKPVRLHYEFLRIHLFYRRPGSNWISSLGNKNNQSRVVELRDSQDRPYANGAKFLLQSSWNRKTLTLYGGSNKHEPLVFCEKKRNEHHVTISGLRRLIPGEHAYSEPKMETLPMDDGGRNVASFYPWLRLTWGRELFGKNNSFGIVFLLTNYDEESIEVSDMQVGLNSIEASGQDKSVGSRRNQLVGFEPFYKIEQRDVEGPPPRAKKKTKKKPVALSIKDYYHDERVGVIKNFQSSSLIGSAGGDIRDATVEVAPGVDPSIILSIAACLKHICH